VYIKINCCICVQSFQIISSLAWILWVFLLLSWLPTVAAQPPLPSKSFPNPTFQAFSNFILSSEISLTTTLLILFSLINNPELLNLHARQTHPAFPDENISKASGWMKTLARGLGDRLDYDLSHVLQRSTDSTWVTELALQLDAFTVFLGLSPYKSNGKFHRKITTVSQESIIPVQLICPPNMTCTTASCRPYHISQRT